MKKKPDAAIIHVRFAVPGIHRWPGAAGERAYLGNDHRHLFTVEVSTTVTHDDREVEFHDLRDEALGLFVGLGQLGERSCEMIARTLAGALSSAHQRRPVAVTVWEDNECGATVMVEKEEAPGEVPGALAYRGGVF